MREAKRKCCVRENNLKLMQDSNSVTTLLSVGVNNDSRSGSIVMDELADELVEPLA